MSVPAPHARGATLLRCPVCAGGLRMADRSLVCDQRHTFDVARHGHVTLLRGAPPTGDDAEMVAARAAVFDAGHYAPLTRALAAAAGETRGGGKGRGDAASAGAAAERVVLDLGAGTGHHLAGVLDALPGALGIALDTSRPALRHAARAHADIAAIVADVWAPLPLRDDTVDLVLDVFSPRNAAEMARVLRPGGTALVVIPTPEHLAELSELHGVHVDPAKVERLERTVGAHLELAGREAVRWTMELDAEDVERVLEMSPAGAHRREGVTPRAATVSGSVELWTFRSPDVGGRAGLWPGDLADDGG
ncbi:methyltransferase domain-containing protein [Solirubrobacter sp. CPCC 204708]|uniref:Methyltransferase domain-containing protein n=1 Tax=Solirubrobacter deserti TaxID=2282478 RepID=A0ABT4RCK6_9ACTN|nr:methyltransferase domain-containing protein [Solirubrobacter deserti]MBE2315624.1 methyltransferase domain-containing protein [Solirubrobacter deserti]MDA0136263.1 methyltransferase domain-containing protein [Solirubrobacter deserti]